MSAQPPHWINEKGISLKCYSHYCIVIFPDYLNYPRKAVHINLSMDGREIDELLFINIALSAKPPHSINERYIRKTIISVLSSSMYI
jgi:hypothetical protein